MRLQIILDPTEANALLKLANAELRDPREQIRHILRRELQRRKLLLAERETKEARPGLERGAK